MQKDEPTCFTLSIIPMALLDFETVWSGCCFPVEQNHLTFFTFIRATKSFKLCGELLKSTTDFSRVCKNQKANPSSLNAFIARCGWAWLFFSLLASSHILPTCQFLIHSQPRRGGGLDFQKSKRIVVNCDHHSLLASKESILEVVGDYSTRCCCTGVCLVLPIHLEHITLHKVDAVVATWATLSRDQIIKDPGLRAAKTSDVTPSVEWKCPVL